jgi:hypothetical protein
VFKPIPTEEFLQMQTEILKNVERQMKDAKGKIAPSQSIDSIQGVTIRSDLAPMASEQSRHRMALYNDLEQMVRRDAGRMNFLDSIDDHIRRIE